MPLDHVFFDFGGTLVEPWVGIAAAFEAAFRDDGTAFDRAAFDRACEEVDAGRGTFEATYLGQPAGYADRYHGWVLERMGMTKGLDRLVARLHHVATAASYRRPFPEVDGLLAELAGRGITSHLVSNNTEYLLEAIDDLGWRRRFTTVTYSQEAGAAKPDPRIFRLALRRAGVPASRGLFVGDSWEADILGARAVGLRAAWVPRDDAPAPEPVDRLRDLRDLLPLVQGP